MYGRKRNGSNHGSTRWCMHFGRFIESSRRATVSIVLRYLHFLIARHVHLSYQKVYLHWTRAWNVRQVKERTTGIIYLCPRKRFGCPNIFRRCLRASFITGTCNRAQSHIHSSAVKLERSRSTGGTGNVNAHCIILFVPAFLPRKSQVK